MVEKKYIEKIFENLAVNREPLSPYDLKKTGLSYSGIRDNMVRLCNEGYLQQLESFEKSKTGGVRTIYTLTFKGVLKYLSTFKIGPDSLNGVTMKTIIEAREKFDKTYEKDLLNMLERQGKNLDYVPFQEIQCLSKCISGLVRSLIIKAQILFEHPLNSSIFADKFNKNISDPKFGFDTNDLKALREFEDRDLRYAFGKVFLQTVVDSIKKENVNENDILRQFAEKILAENRKEISVLEQAVTLFSKK